MPSIPAEKPRHRLIDFADVLRLLSEEGFDYAVIGGLAVSAYAHLIDTEFYSADLDIVTTWGTLSEILDWAPSEGIRIVKRPKPRNIPVAFLEFEGKEINILTGSHGLPSVELVMRTARPFIFAAEGHLEVPVADPFDLLANKLAVRREKDLPHIEILRRFVEEEAVTAFKEEDKPRARIAPARRLLDVFDLDALPEHLAEELLEISRTPADYRFLANNVPTAEHGKQLMDRLAEQNPGLVEQLGKILARRNLTAR